MVKFSFLWHVFHLLFLKKKDLFLHRSSFPTIFKEGRIHAVLCHVVHTEDAPDKLQEDNSYLAPAGEARQPTGLGCGIGCTYKVSAC